MAKVDDVAAYILAKRGKMTTWQFQKLVYYSQAWHLAWEGVPLFKEPIEAWANGPVVAKLYAQHREKFTVGTWRGDTNALKRSERSTVDAVLAAYGPLSGRQLSAMTHSERPWQEAREGLAPTARSTRTISQETMQEFYAALDMDESAASIASFDWSQFE